MGSPESFNKVFIEKYQKDKYRDLFLQFLMTRREENTRIAYYSDLKKYANFLLEKGVKLPFSEQTPLLISEYKEYLIKYLNQSDKTVKRALSSLKKFFDFLIEQGVGVNKNPVASVEKPIVQLSVKTPGLTNEELSTFIRSIRLFYSDKSIIPSGFLYRAISTLMFNTGLRTSEALSLTVDSIKSSRGDCYVNVKVKSGGVVDVPLNAVSKKAIDDYLNAYKQSFDTKFYNECFLFIPSKDIDGFYPRDNRYALSPQMLRKFFKKHSIKIFGEEGAITPHSCRATLAGILYEKGIALEDQADFLRHRDPRMTMEYNKRREGAKRKISDSLSLS